jgi:hypothetical protein
MSCAKLLGPFVIGVLVFGDVEVVIKGRARLRRAIGNAQASKRRVTYQRLLCSAARNWNQGVAQA